MARPSTLAVAAAVATACAGLISVAAAARPVATQDPTQEETAALDLQRGDEAWARRADAPGPTVLRAIAHYEDALAAQPANLTARWKLVRALYFQGELVLAEEESRRAAFERGRDLAEVGLDRLAADLGRTRGQLEALEPEALAGHLAGDAELRREAAGVYFWGAVCWGLWGESVGKLQAARQGVGGRIRDYSERVVALDVDFAGAGGLRLLGRLHAVAPRIPFFTFWVDRDFAIESLRRAQRLAPEELHNRLYLAEALLDHRPEARAEALRWLEETAAQEPRPGHRIEDASVIARARARLAEERP